ncbi:GNAT family N-acetyltransferase [soil metagenome]
MDHARTTTLKADSVEIREMMQSDWEGVKSIYEAGIATKNATFETSAGTWKKWNSDHLTSPRLVAENSDQILGWAALSPVSGRCVYGGVAEVSVYIANAAQEKGVGTALLDRLITKSEQQNIWTLQAGIFPENKASLRLHEKMGFRIVGKREKIGKMDGQWRDVVLMERRSKNVM